MSEFEILLSDCNAALERFVKFRVNNREDAEDILQEVRLSAFLSFKNLKNADSFKPWIFSIARNKCMDYYRRRERDSIVKSDDFTPDAFGQSRYGLMCFSSVDETMEKLGANDREILRLFYFENRSVSEISALLNIPAGTVKSRLHTARQNFRNRYPCPPKGEKEMFTKLPLFMPEYTIAPSDKAPFTVRWEEIMGWFIVPRLGEKISWAMYDFPTRRRTEYMTEEVVGRAEVHSVEGVSILAKEYEPMENNRIDGRNYNERQLVAQLTDTHCRILAESHESGGVKRYYTFLDGDAFLDNWGFGEENCGNEIYVSPKGDISRDGDKVTSKDKPFLLDIVGRYNVTVNSKTYDTVLVMDIANYCGEGVVTEQFLDKNGKTVLWRRFNKNDWQLNRRGRLWTEQLPDNERLYVNSETYVHWYDCITDYIL